MGVILGREQNVSISSKRSRPQAEKTDRTHMQAQIRRIERNRKKIQKSIPESEEEREFENKKEQVNTVTKKVTEIASASSAVVSNAVKKQSHRKEKRAERKKKKSAREIDLADAADSAEYDGKPAEADDSEHTGKNKVNNADILNNKGIKAGLKIVLVYIMIFLKAFISAVTNIVIIIAVVIVVVVVVTVSVIQSATYNFVVDEEAHIREIMSNVTYELTNEIEAVKNENDCDAVISSGELAEWKEVIALWWTLKTHISEAEEWENYFESDQEDIKYIFYQFNHIEYEIQESSGENEMSHKILKVIITNTSLDELRDHWGLTDVQNAYLDSLLENEEVWKEILGTTELSSIAYAEIGNPASKYEEYYDSDGGDTGAFVTWCMEQAGLISNSYIQGSVYAEDLQEELAEKGFCVMWLYKPEEGDIVFLSINDKTEAGIVTRVEDDIIYVAAAGLNGHSSVEEAVYNTSSAAIAGYAHISDFFVQALDSSGRAEFGWPVDGYYYVTSSFGARDLAGTTFHHGLDVGCPEGTPIFASEAGTVALATYNSSLGYYVSIDHGNGISTTYGHNSVLLVEQGQYVAKGDVIAMAGNTGFSFGAHCHFAVLINGSYVDPAPYLGLPTGFIGDATEYVK